jgi:hypothetical protein
VDLGTTDQEYKGVTSKKTRVHLSFEITDSVDPSTNTVMMDDGRPFGAWKTYTASLFEAAALRKDLESWRGKSFTEEELAGFDISKLIGCTAKIEVGHTQATEFSPGGNPKILALREPKDGVQVVDTHNDTLIFDLDIYCNEWRVDKDGKSLSDDQSKAMCDVFESLPDWQKNDINESYELVAAKKEFEDRPIEDTVSTDNSEGFDDDIPF